MTRVEAQKENYFEIINKFALDLLEAQTDDDIAWVLAKNAIAELGYQDCVIYLLDDKENTLLQKAALGNKDSGNRVIYNQIKLKIGEGVVGSVAETGIGEIIKDTSIDNRYIVDDEIRYSEITVPIIYENKVLGIIDSEHPEKNFFTNEDFQILTTIASMTASKLAQTKSNAELIKLKKNLEKMVSKRTLELKKVLVKVHQQRKEITENIHYAKRIQKAILPSDRIINDYFKDNFIFYQPKDIVAGDFYWFEKYNEKIVFAVADCTGHGVSGAMVSIVCHNALNRALHEFGIEKPNEILDKVKSLVIETFSKNEEIVLDGMDLALCSLDPKTNILQFSGANNPLYIIRDNELLEIKADKQPIGKYDIENPFTLKEFQLQKNDMVYIFTDGFPDQFGGPKGKKMKYNRFKELLNKVSQLPIKQQDANLRLEFEAWKGTLEQIDDVTIIGLRV